jgi:hypothetical protein
MEEEEEEVEGEEGLGKEPMEQKNGGEEKRTEQQGSLSRPRRVRERRKSRGKLRSGEHEEKVNTQVKISTIIENSF